MRLRYILCAAAISATFICQSQQINPITKAVLEGYTEILNKNPKDYNTLYQRAAQYYSMSDYDRALNDIIKAVEYTPAKQTDERQSEYSLMCDIYTELKDYNKALLAIDAALETDPNNYSNLYKKGNTLLHLGEGEKALGVFKTMQRQKSRSQEAFFGMAKANLLMGNNKEAEDLIKEAEKVDPNNYITYCRIGNLYEDLGRNNDAAASYLSAFGLAEDTSRPLSELIKLGQKDFNAVSETIDYALEKSSAKAPLYFLKANIAYLTGNYNQAHEAFNSLVAIPEGREGSVYSRLAKTEKALNRLEDAEKNADLALLKDKSADVLLIKSEIDLANNKPSFALLNAKRAYEATKSNESLMQMAKANYDLEEYETAVKQLNEVILNNAFDPRPLLLRAHITGEKLNNPKAAMADYLRISQTDASTPYETVCKAIGKYKCGKKIDSDLMIENYLKEHQTKDDLFYCAIYYAQSGNKDKAKELRDKAVEKGYQNLYNLNTDTTPDFNLKPIR